MGKRVLKQQASPLRAVAKGAYIVVFILSLLIVGIFIACKVAVTPPDVESEVTFPVGTPAPDSEDPNAVPDGDEEEPVVVYTRREGVYTCLLTGSDDGSYRADTIMVGCFDTNAKTASLLSIPRDTLVRYNSKNTKINAVYSHGVEALAETVSGLLGIPVDFYVSVDLDAFQEIVDTIGGVWFDVPIDMDYDDPYQDLHIHLDKGYQLLGPEDAMGVVRFRHNNDGSGYVRQDLDRVETQRKFLTALVSQTITLSNVTKVTKLIGILNDYVDTNMPLDHMVYFATEAIGMDLSADLTTGTLPGQWISPYIEVTDDEALALVNELFPVYTEAITADIMNIHHK